MFQFQQKLNAHKDTISDLLLHLQDLTGLVYLHDQQNPIIAFFPQQYLICQSSISTFFEAELLQLFDENSCDRDVCMIVIKKDPMRMNNVMTGMVIRLTKVP